SFGRHFKCPCDNQRDREADNDQQNNQPNRPVRNIKNWKYLRDALRKRPSAHDVRHGNFVDIAPLQFGKEGRLLVHRSRVAGNWTPSFWHKATKRGSSRYSKRKGVITSWVRPES